MRARRKLKNKSGFSLAETLLAVLILLLVSTIVANGIPVAKNVYNKVIVGANAQLLLSTTVTALRNELATAQRIEVSKDGKTVVYYKASISAFSMIDLGTDHSIQVTDYIDMQCVNRTIFSNPSSATWTMIPDGVEGSTREARKLITSAAANGNLVVTYDPGGGNNAIVYDQKDMITFNGIQVKNGDSVIAELDTLNIRIIPLTAIAA